MTATGIIIMDKRLVPSMKSDETFSGIPNASNDMNVAIPDPKMLKMLWSRIGARMLSVI